MFSRALRVLLAVSLSGAPAFAEGAREDAPSSRQQADQLEIALRAVRLAFETGVPPIETARPTLESLSDGADDAGRDPAWAQRRRDAARRLLATLDEVKGLQAGMAYAPKRAISGMGQAETAMIAGLVQTVARLSDVLEIPEAARRAAIADLYLRRWQKDRNGLTPAAIAAERRFAEASLKRSMRAEAESRRKATARLRDAGALRSGSADAVSAAGAAPSGGRTVAEVIAEARRQGDPRVNLRSAAPPPSFAASLRESADRDEEAMRYGGDDGTAWGAFGRGTAWLRKTAAGVSAYFVDGETWDRTGSALVGLASHPVDSIVYLPGGVYAGGREVVKGVKTDIVNAREEAGNFLEHPTVYRGLAVFGSTSLALSNAFLVGGGAKSALRRGAARDVDIAARDAARRVVRGEAIGATAEAAAARKAVTHPVEDAIYRKTAADGMSIPRDIEKGFVEVKETVTTSAEKQLLFQQKGPYCVFGAVCNMFQGVEGAGPKEVLASIQKKNPRYMLGAMETSGIDAASMESVFYDVCGKSLRAPVELATPDAMLAHMRQAHRPVLVGVQMGTGKHAITLSEAIVTKEGKTYFKTLDTNISEHAGSGLDRATRFGLITPEDLGKILTTKGYSFL